ncbi:AtpZ/AtpI family protein [Fusobacterium sp.]|uniref:AtpZ/AtpI family protein n=1 Tax=Fusobacterium sp. TaxID=68766 RepID=UPI00342F39FD
MLKFDREFFKYFSLLGTLGFIIIGNILVSLAIYKYIIARYIYESPILFIIFLILGVISGFYNVYTQIMKK